jgi:hypothetical protein
MSNFLRTVATRGLAASPAAVRPRLRSRFEPDPETPTLRLPVALRPAETPVVAHPGAEPSGPMDRPATTATTVRAHAADPASPRGAAPAADRADPVPAPGQPSHGPPADRAAPAVAAGLEGPQREVTPAAGDAQPNSGARPPAPPQPPSAVRTSTDPEMPSEVPPPIWQPAVLARPPALPRTPDQGATDQATTPGADSRTERTVSEGAPDPPGAASTGQPRRTASHLTTVAERTTPFPPAHGSPVTPTLPPVPRSASQPSISVTIGRIDVLAVLEPAPLPRASNAPSRRPGPSLEEYLRQRTRRSR